MSARHHRIPRSRTAAEDHWPEPITPITDRAANPGLPRARIDPITTAGAAIAVIEAVRSRPMQHETVILALDEQRRGHTIVLVTGTVDHDQVLDVIEMLAPSANVAGLPALVVASVRPAAVPQASDSDRWLELCALTDVHGVELVEWFIVSGSVWCPRDLLGVPPRW